MSKSRLSQQAPAIGRVVVSSLLMAQGHTDAASGVEQIGERGVVHGVAAARAVASAQDGQTGTSQQTGAKTPAHKAHPGG